MVDNATRTSAARRLAEGGVTKSVRSCLEPFRGARVVYPLHVDDRGNYVGNNGDLLIMAGVERLFEDLEFEIAESDDAADVVVMCGGGGLMERGRWVRGILRDHSQRLGHLPMVVLPSSFDFPTRPLAAEIGERKAPITLYCREAYSYLHLLEDHDLPAGCSVELDHDMAFELNSTPLLERLGAIAGEDVLIVERTDVEHPGVAFDSTRSKKTRLVKRLIPGPLRPLAWRVRHAFQSRAMTPMRTRCEALIAEHYEKHAGLPRRVVDVSNPRAGDFEYFAESVAKAALIFSTRLHVAILGSMLDRETVVYEGPYHKIRGVYEFSLANKDHVRLDRV